MTRIVHDNRKKRKKEKKIHIPLSRDGGSVHVVTRKLDLDETSMAHTHMERHRCDKDHFSVANLFFIRLI